MSFVDEPRTRMDAALIAIDESGVPSDTLITTNPFPHVPRHVALEDGTVYDRRDGGAISDLISRHSAEVRDLNERIGALGYERDELCAKNERMRVLAIDLLDTVEQLAGGPDDYFRPIFADLGIGLERLGKTVGDLIKEGEN